MSQQSRGMGFLKTCFFFDNWLKDCLTQKPNETEWKEGGLSYAPVS
jgi:hypothetical protein